MSDCCGLRSFGTKRTGISVIVPTYNRCDFLRRTLEAMCLLDYSELDVEFVVVDNNSNDRTPDVIGSFVGRLPIQHRFEGKPGKNSALNHALDKGDLREIVVFTDNDVIPRRDWIQQIAAACERWPAQMLFGGQIEHLWPEGLKVPKWATDVFTIRAVGFGEQGFRADDEPYGEGSHPTGANFWVRRSVFEGNVRFSESRWTRPGKHFGLGDETEFIQRLAERHGPAMHIPTVIVGHHVQTNLLEPRTMLRRFILFGRGKPHVQGMPDPEDFVAHPWRWRARRVAALTWHLVGSYVVRLHWEECARMEKATHAVHMYAYHRESLAMSWAGADCEECPGTAGSIQPAEIPADEAK